MGYRLLAGFREELPRRRQHTDVTRNRAGRQQRQPLCWVDKQMTVSKQLRCLLAGVVVAGSLPVAPASAQDGCSACCGQTYRLECQTIYEEKQITCYRTVCETAYEEREITRQVPVYETQQRERRYAVLKPVRETSTRQERYTVQRPVYETQ